jgi:cell division protein FtsW
MSIKKWLEIGKKSIPGSALKLFNIDSYIQRFRKIRSQPKGYSPSVDFLEAKKLEDDTSFSNGTKGSVQPFVKKNPNPFFDSKTHLVKSIISISSSFPLGGIALFLLCLVFLLFVLGLVMVFDTSAAEIIDLGSSRNIYSALIKQIIFAILGVGLGFGVWVIGYHNILKLSFPLLCFFTFLLVLVFIPGIGVSANGARRWVGFAGFSLQPSEFVKYLIPIFYTSEFLKTGRDGLSFRAFLKIISKISIPMILILMEPDNRTTGIIGLTLFVMLTLTRVRFRFWALPMGILMIIGAVAAYHVPYVSKRINVYLHPELDLKGKGHQPYQAKIAVGSGGLLGKGPGESLQKLNYLPEAQNDYIVAIFAEEYGFVGVLLLILSYMVICYFGFYIAINAPDLEGLLIAASMTFLISLQAFMNFGVVSGLLPSTGLNLPFFSQGGSSLWVNIAAFALILHVAATTKKINKGIV